MNFVFIFTLFLFILLIIIFPILIMVPVIFISIYTLFILSSLSSSSSSLLSSSWSSSSSSSSPSSSSSSPWSSSSYWPVKQADMPVTTYQHGSNSSSNVSRHSGNAKTYSAFAQSDARLFFTVFKCCLQYLRQTKLCTVQGRLRRQDRQEPFRCLRSQSPLRSSHPKDLAHHVVIIPRASSAVPPSVWKVCQNPQTCRPSCGGRFKK